MNNYLMIDKETLALDNPVVIQLGFVVFNKDKVLWTSSYNICPKSCVAIGMEMDLDTVSWWLKTNPSLLTSILDGNSVSIEEALSFMFNVYKSFNCKGVMSNGSLADIKWVHQLVKGINKTNETKIEIPWSYKEEMCFRTMRALFPQYKGVEFGERHDALNDARYQVSVVQEIMNKEGVAL